MFLLNDKPLGLDVPFSTPDGTQYPANWLRLASAEEKAAIGITEVPDAPAYDDRFYYAPGIPKDVDQCKQVMIAQMKVDANRILSNTDWKVVRAAETGIALDAQTAEYRAAVRAVSNDTEVAIQSAADVDALAAIQIIWPE